MKEEESQDKTSANPQEKPKHPYLHIYGDIISQVLEGHLREEMMENFTLLAMRNDIPSLRHQSG